MWKLLPELVKCSAFSIFMLRKGGDKVGMDGESGGHSMEVPATPPAAAPVLAPAPAK